MCWLSALAVLCFLAALGCALYAAFSPNNGPRRPSRKEE